MIEALLLLVAIGLLAGLALGLWSRRRHARPAAAPIRTAQARATLQAPPAPDADAAPPPVSMQIQPWMHRLYALAFDPAGNAAVPQAQAGNEQAAVLAAAVAVLERIESQPRYTPRRPQLLPQLMQAVNDSEASGKSIAAIVAQDPTLAGNLLRIANSPLYRVQALPVENIERAVVMLGTDGIRQIIAAALMQPVAATGGGAFGRLPALLWEHSLLSATTAAGHAKRVERDDAFAAQMLGLLHGLGASVVVQVLRDEYARHPQLAPDAGAVVALLDAWAAPTAQRIAASWALSDRIDAALHEQAGTNAGGSSPLGRSLRFGRLAGALALLLRQGHLQEAEAQAVLATLEPDAAARAALWQRLQPATEAAATTA